MDTTTFTDLTDSATADLKDDPELRLAVKSELLDHLEESVRTLAGEGNSEQQSRELAMQAFGSPLEISGKLLTANKTRMRLRALLHLAIRGLLVPAALLLAFFLAWGVLSQTQQELGIFKYIYPARLTTGVQIAKSIDAVPKLPPLPLRYNPGGKRLLTDRRVDELSLKIDVFYNLWQKDPTNRVYYANYAGYSSGGQTVTVHGGNGLSDEEYMKLMRTGELIDPDNALYNYLICCRLLPKAVRDRGTVGNNPSFELTDRRIIEQAMQEYRAGLRKPYCRTYHLEMLRDRIQQFPSTGRLNDQLFRLYTAGSILCPEFAKLRYLAQVVSYDARLARQEGRVAESDTLFASRLTFSRQIAQGDDSLIGQIVAKAIYSIIANGAVDEYAQTGEAAKAQRIRRQLNAIQSLSAIFPSWGQSSNGLLTLLLPCNPAHSQHNSDLLPITQVEHIALEEAALGVVLVVLLIVMLCYVIAMIYWRITALWETGNVPLLLLPDGKSLARILLLGVLAPVGVYIAVVHWLRPAWRAASITQTGEYSLLAMGAFALVLLLLPAMLAGRYIRRRCYQLGMPLPKKGSSTTRWPAWYYGTLTQSLLPIFAAVTIFLGGFFYPYLVSQEQWWIRQDRLLFWQDNTVHALCPLEERLKTDLQTKMLQVWEKDAQEVSGERGLSLPHGLLRRGDSPNRAL